MATEVFSTEIAALTADLAEARRQLSMAQEDLAGATDACATMRERVDQAEHAIREVRRLLLESGKIDLAQLPNIVSPKVHVDVRVDQEWSTGNRRITLEARQHVYSYVMRMEDMENVRAWALAAEKAGIALGDEIARTISQGLMEFRTQKPVKGLGLDTYTTSDIAKYA